MTTLYYKCLRPACWLKYSIEKGEEIICPQCRSKMVKRRYPIMFPKRHWRSKELKADKMIEQVNEKWDMVDKEMEPVYDPNFKNLSKEVRKSLNKIKKKKKKKK